MVAWGRVYMGDTEEQSCLLPLSFTSGVSLVAGASCSLKPHTLVAAYGLILVYELVAGTSSLGPHALVATSIWGFKLLVYEALSE